MRIRIAVVSQSSNYLPGVSRSSSCEVDKEKSMSGTYSTVNWFLLQTNDADAAYNKFRMSL